MTGDGDLLETPAATELDAVLGLVQCPGHQTAHLKVLLRVATDNGLVLNVSIPATAAADLGDQLFRLASNARAENGTHPWPDDHYDNGHDHDPPLLLGADQ